MNVCNVCSVYLSVSLCTLIDPTEYESFLIDNYFANRHKNIEGGKA